jgi:hypothetical protein
MQSTLLGLVRFALEWSGNFISRNSNNRSTKSNDDFPGIFLFLNAAKAADIVSSGQIVSATFGHVSRRGLPRFMPVHAHARSCRVVGDYRKRGTCALDKAQSTTMAHSRRSFCGVYNTLDCKILLSLALPVLGVRVPHYQPIWHIHPPRQSQLLLYTTRCILGMALLH